MTKHHVPISMDCVVSIVHVIGFAAMRKLLVLANLVLAILATASSVTAREPLKMYSVPLVEEPSPYANLNLSPAQLIAAQELELAQYRFIGWLNYEYPLQVRRYDADIALAQEELASLQRRQAEFSRFNVWSRGGNPQFLASEDTGLAIVATQQRLSLLQTERGQVMQWQPVEYRKRQIDLERARMNLRTAR